MSVADEICAGELTEHEYLAQTGIPGPEILKSQIREARRDVSGLALTIEDIVESGDTVWARMVARGTDLRSGKEIVMTVIDICRFEDGRLVEHWGVPDRFALLHQLGLLPQPPA
jgi:ketosteroid isomerase-like protein